MTGVIAVPTRKGGWWLAVTATRATTPYHNEVTSVVIIADSSALSKMAKNEHNIFEGDGWLCGKYAIREM